MPSITLIVSFICCRDNHCSLWKRWHLYFLANFYRAAAMQARSSYEYLSVCQSVYKRMYCDKTKAPSEKSSTRKRAIAKALQLKGHLNFAPVDLAYYQHFLGFFCSKILRFGKLCLATTNAEHVEPRPLSTLNKQQISQSICVGCYIRCDLDLWPFDLEPAYWLSRAKTLC